MTELVGVTIRDYDVSIQTVAVAMIHKVMETNQDSVEALEIIFEQAVIEARELLLDCIHGD